MKYISVLLLLFVLTCGCKSSINELVLPEQEGPPPPPGPRNYTWEIDTVRTFNPLWRIWGASMTDIWTCTSGNLYHFDGKTWQEDKRIYPEVIGGTDTNDIWAAGSKRVWHYDGKQWTLFTDLMVVGYSYSFYNGISVVSNNEIYLFGSTNTDSTGHIEALLYKYDGKKWERTNFREKDVSIVTAVKKDNELILGCSYWPPNARDTTRLYSWADNKTTLVSRDTKGMNEVQKFGDKVVLNIEKRIYEYKWGQLNMLKDLSQTGFVGAMCGRTENDFFCNMTDNRVAHYNGTDFEYMEGISRYNCNPSGRIVFADAIVLLLTDWTHGYNLICRGKLSSRRRIEAR